MCGIVGIIARTQKGQAKIDVATISKGTKALERRGPDAEGTYIHNKVALGHRRLSIIDTSSAGTQPFTDETGRYTIVFNGEFFNYQPYRDELIKQGIVLRSTSDTEVLLELYKQDGASCLSKINGFFALAIYDNVEETVFIARDRFGVKPLLVYEDENNIIFASEMKALLAMGIPKKINKASLFGYIQLNYTMPTNSIMEGVKKLEAGTFLFIKNNISETKKYYTINNNSASNKLSFDVAKSKLVSLLTDAVERRMIADVPLGSFLSGGIDSSIITAIAAKYNKKLQTFSIGYADEPMFDETKYAELVAKKHNTHHTVFKLTNNHLFEHLHNALDYIDEPFADSSALAVNILSYHTKKHVTVALSGDGADELFAGYNKHAAEYSLRNYKLLLPLLKSTKALWDILPKSRNSFLGNKIRQLQKISEGASLSMPERYWRFASITTEQQANKLLTISSEEHKQFNIDKNNFIKNINDDFNSFLMADMQLVLQGDMLPKVDYMSMNQSLEVRNPFLDYTVVDFAFSLPSTYKINSSDRKIILKEAFKNELPPELFHRPKHGFEVPLLKWFQNDLKSMITEDLLSDKFIKEQNLFNLTCVQALKQQLFSNNPNDATTQVWALIVFQHWWKKYFIN